MLYMENVHTNRAYRANTFAQSVNLRCREHFAQCWYNGKDFGFRLLTALDCGVVIPERYEPPEVFPSNDLLMTIGLVAK